MTLLIALLCTQDAVAADVDAALDAMAASKPGDAAAYVGARAKILALGRSAVPLLESRGAAASWTAAGWVRAAAAEACRVRLVNPEVAGEVDRPAGLDPAVYGKFRRPMPLCLRDFVHRGADTIPLLIERWRWTLSEMKFSDGDAGKAERETFLRAIVETPGQVADGRARHFLAAILADGAADVELRHQAGISLGQTGGVEAIAPLTAILDDARAAERARVGSALGLGRVADPAALDAIRARLDGAKDQVEILRALLTALGNLGSSWAWESRGRQAAATAATIRAGCAETLVTWVKNSPQEKEALTRALLMVAWPASVDALRAAGRDSAASAATKSLADEIAERLEASLKR